MVAQPFSLYLDLEEGEVADIEVVARAALAYAAAVKEIVFILDPTLEVRVELSSGTPGSLSLDSLIRILRAKAEEKPALAAVIVTLFLWFGNYAFNEVIDEIRGKNDLELSNDQIDAIADRVAANMKGNVAAPQVQKVYEELARDEAIKGVGVTVVPGRRPKDIIPRSEFAGRADPAILTEVTSETRRTRTRPERVTIISPVLLTGTRKWKFRSAEGEFGASIKDKSFLQDLVAGRVVLPMTGGVELDVILETIEEFQDRVWVPIEWTVLRVLRPHYPPVQIGLFSPEE